MGKFIFRKIGGRIIPIRISSVKDATHQVGISARKVVAKVAGEQVASLNLRIPHKGAAAFVESVKVEKKFQKHGISRQLFAHAQKLAGRIGKKFLQSSEIQHVAQIKIRSKAGKTVFVGRGMGKWGEESKKLRSREAREIINDLNKYGKAAATHVEATTMIPKKFRRK